MADINYLLKKKITVATSLAPRDLENQRKAVESWKYLGFKVFSVNAIDEIEILKPHFPDVEFMEATRDAREKLGKPYVYLDDVMYFLKKSGADICGIINSDIHFSVSKAFNSFICKEAKDSFLFGSRVDIPSLDNPVGKVLEVGFDYFFFDRKVIDCYPASDFCLGVPCWDYWAELMPLSKGIVIKKIITPVAFHIKHELNWNQQLWVSFALKLFEQFPMPGIKPTPSYDMLNTYALYLLDLINNNAEKILFLPEDIKDKSVIIIYYQQGCCTETYKSLLEQSHKNIKIVSTGDIDFSNIKEDYVYMVEEGFIPKPYFIELMLSSLENEDYGICRQKVLDINERVFDNIVPYEKPNKQCIVYKTASFLDNGRFSPEAIKNKKGKNISVAAIETTLNNYIRSRVYPLRHQNVYIYGAGSHTMQLLENVDFSDINIMGVIDKNNSLEGQRVSGYEIFSFDRIKEKDVDYILISSLTYEREIYDELRQFFDEEKLIRIHYC